MNNLLKFLSMGFVIFANAMFSRTSGLLCASGLVLILMLEVFKIETPMSLYSVIGWGIFSFYVVMCLLGVAWGRSARVRSLISKLQLD